MKIYFDKLYKSERKSELCGLCVPLKKGALAGSDISRVHILDGDSIVPLQTEITSTWDDGSVRYMYLHFLANLPGNARKEFELTWNGEAVEQDAVDDPIRIKKALASMVITNGPISFTVGEGSDRLFEAFSYKGKEISAEQFVGPTMKVDGRRKRTTFDSWSIVKQGPILTVLEGKGRFIPADEKASAIEGLNFEIRLTLTAGKPWVDMGFRFINCTDGDIMPDDLIFGIKSSENVKLTKSCPAISGNVHEVNGFQDGIYENDTGGYTTVVGTRNLKEFDLSGKSAKHVRTMVGRSNYRTIFKISPEGGKVDNAITAEMIEGIANEHFPEVFFGTFFADYTDSEKGFGVCATVFQAYQNFPKAVSADHNGLTVFLIPDQDSYRYVTKAEPVVFTSGMAREQRVLLHFHDVDEPISELDNRSIIYQMPDKPYIDPMEFAEADVMPKIFLPPEKQVDDVEILLVDKADSHPRSYGMLNFGDAPDPNYTTQGRGDGKLVWTNNEYDYPHAMYMMYARTGVRRFADYAEAAARHLMDVDVCHYSTDPLKMGGQWEHTCRHTGGSEEGNGCKGEIVCSHQWVEGLLDLYHFTADERALNTAIGIGNNVLKLLDTPAYRVPGEQSARETGWALRALTALFLETGDLMWIRKCEDIIAQFRVWDDMAGGWQSPYLDNTMIRVGFMISVAIGSLMRYYRAFPGEDLEKMLLKAIDDLVDDFMTPYGLFLYKELPSLSRNGNNTLLLEAMAIGYELTGDSTYLDKGSRTFKRAMATVSNPGGTKKIVEDAVIQGNGTTKNFAQSFLPVTSFYVSLVAANKLLT